ncbi:MAG: hypothetical protein ACREJO_19055 [Phycisphaerales bacterium]
MPTRKCHTWLGVLGLAVFLGTGLYMRHRFPGAYADDASVRYLYRANHAYILLASLVHLALGTGGPLDRIGWGRAMISTGSWFAIVAVPVLIWAFFTEPRHPDPFRPLTTLGIGALLLGVVLVAASAKQPRRA